MDSVELKELDYSLEGIKLGFESIDNLTKLYDNIKNCNYILVPSRVTKTINIALEHTYKTNKLENYTNLSLENNEDTTIFDKILSTIKSIWKKIVETWDYIWDKIVSFFNSTKNKDLEKDIKNDLERSKLIIKNSNKEYSKEELIITNQSLTEPLRYINEELTGSMVLNELRVKVEEISYSLEKALESLFISYNYTYNDLKRINIDKIDKLSISELDEKLYSVFFTSLIENSKKINKEINSDDVEIVESIISETLNNINGKINIKESSCIKGFIKGGVLFFYLIENKEDPNARSFECLAVDKISDENNKISLYYLDKDSIDAYNEVLQGMVKKYTSLDDEFTKKSKEIKIIHNEFRKIIDSFIKNSNVILEENPDDFRAKFETLKNISHSMLRYALELSKGFGMYQDTLNYYVKYGKASLEFYEKDIKKGS